MSAVVKTASKAVVNVAVAVADQEPEPVSAVAEVREQVRACWVTQAPVG